MSSMANTYTQQPSPKNTHHHPPHSLHFYFEHEGETLDGDSAKQTTALFEREMTNRNHNRPRHGAIPRLADKINIRPSSVGRNSYLRKLIMGTANSHTRLMRQKTEYATLHVMHRTGQWKMTEEEVVKQVRKTPDALKCPFCTNQPDHARGNSRHLHILCQHPKIMDL